MYSKLVSELDKEFNRKTVEKKGLNEPVKGKSSDKQQQNKEEKK